MTAVFLGAISRFPLQSFYRRKAQKRISTAIGAKTHFASKQTNLQLLHLTLAFKFIYYQYHTVLILKKKLKNHLIKKKSNHILLENIRAHQEAKKHLKPNLKTDTN